jgi:anti-sigma B factor antagonist
MASQFHSESKPDDSPRAAAGESSGSNPREGPLMSVDREFEHIRLSKVDDVVLIEILSSDVQGPDRATLFSAELIAVANQESADPILLDMSRCVYFSSMGYSALFKLVKRTRERQRRIKFCNMHPDVKVGADIIGLYHVVEIYDCRESALEAFGHA